MTSGSDIDISILICTYNRAEELRRSLATHAAMIAPPSLRWELLVVDNNSTDHTPEVVRSFEGTLPIGYICEKAQGKSNALNRGISESRGRLFLMTDDDVDVDPLWLKNFAEAAERMPDTPFFAGRILSRLPRNPPRWFAEHAQSILSVVAVHLDLGDRECRVEAAFGANMAIWAHLFANGRLFRPDLGPAGAEPVRSEEAQLFQDILDTPGTNPGMYIPTALVYHRTNASRMTEAYIRHWYYGDGIAKVRRNQIDPGAMLFNIPRYLWRRLFVSALRYVILRPFAPSRSWLLQEIDMATTFGVISELRRMNKRKAPPGGSKRECT
jgi:glycosyltransferase involved in cell wall biosynthesis